MQIEDTQYARKLDPTGRLVIPIRLREQLGLLQGETYDFKIIRDEGKTYLSIECPSEDINKAIELVRQAGYTVE